MKNVKRHEFFCVMVIGFLASTTCLYQFSPVSFYCAVLNFATAWIAFYCLGNIWGSVNIGIVCSALYTLSIHRIFILVVHEELKAGSALAFLPLVLYGLYGILWDSSDAEGRRLPWLSLSIGCTGLVLTHIPTYEITILAALILCICRLPKMLRPKTWAELAKALLAHLLSAAVIMILFRHYYGLQIAEQKSLSAETIQSRGLYLLHLLCQFWNPETLLSMEGWDLEFARITGMGFGLVAVLALFLILWFAGSIRENGGQERLSFAKVCTLLSLLMMLMSLNSFPWDRLQSQNQITAVLVGSLETPGYFLGWATLTAVTVFGCLLWHWEHRNTKLYWLCIALAAASIATSSLYLMDYAAAWRFR